MTLTGLRCLVAIADAGLNITAASMHAHATQSALSRQLRQLEDEIGVTLVSRKGKRLDAITPAGEQVLARARAILREARNIRAIAANLRDDGEGALTIVTTHTQARFLLPPAIRALKLAYPALAVHLKAQGEGAILDVMEQGQADLAIISTSGTPPRGGLAVPLFHWRRCVVVRPDHALARLRRPLRLADLAAQPLLGYESSLRAESSLQQAFATEDLTPRFVFTAADADLIKAYVRAGLGVGIFAEMALTAADAPALRALDAGTLFPECTTWLVLPRDRVLRSFTAALAHLIAPQLDPRDLARALLGDAPPEWPSCPAWEALAVNGPALPRPRAGTGRHPRTGR